VECFPLAPADRATYLSRSGDLKVCWFDGFQTGSVGHSVRPDMFANYSVAVCTPHTSVLCFSSNVNHFQFLTLIFANCNLYRQLNA
jgi:hypothetical protein